MTRLRVAIAHDYLTQRGGAERVALSLLRAFPDAELYTTLYRPEGTFPEFREARIVTSWLNQVAAFRRDHRLALPLLAAAANSLRIEADVVVASSSGWAHGFPTSGAKLVYCHSPARYLYLSEQYLGGNRRGLKGLSKALLLKALRRPLIAWDQKAARSADRYLCNSTVIQQRIRDTYGIEAHVLAPPHTMVATGAQTPVAELQDWADSGFYLVVSRLLPYKNVAAAIQAFEGLSERLVIVGRGPERDRLRSLASTNVRLVEGLSDAALRWCYAQANALLAPSFEDFGLTPLEAGAFGKPTLALGAGGYLDTVVPGRTGAFFPTPSPSDIRAAVSANRRRRWNREAIVSHVETFSEERFLKQLRREVARLAARQSPG